MGTSEGGIATGQDLLSASLANQRLGTSVTGTGCIVTSHNKAFLFSESTSRKKHKA